MTACYQYDMKKELIKKIESHIIKSEIYVIVTWDISCGEYTTVFCLN